MCFLGVSEGRLYVLKSQSLKLSSSKTEEYLEAVNESRKPDFIVKESNIELAMEERLREKGVHMR